MYITALINLLAYNKLLGEVLKFQHSECISCNLHELHFSQPNLQEQPNTWEQDKRIKLSNTEDQRSTSAIATGVSKSGSPAANRMTGTPACARAVA